MLQIIGMIGGQVVLAWTWRHPQADRPLGAGHLYIGHRIYLYHGSNGSSSSDNMHVIVEVIFGRVSIVDIV